MTAEREAMTLEQGSKMLREMRWGADVGEDMMRLADLLDHLSRDAEPVAYVVTPKNPAFGPSLVFKPGEFASEYALIEPLYGHPPEPARDAKDAARYRWLRDTQTTFGKSARYDDSGAPLFYVRLHGYGTIPANVDASIDAAMAQESGE